MKKSTLKKALGAGAVTGLLAFSSGAMAASNSEQAFLSFPQALERLRQAHSAVHANASVQRLLEKSDANSLSMLNQVVDADLATTKFQHFFKGLEVVGAKVFHHRGLQGDDVDSTIVDFNVDTNPTLSADEAVSIAHSLVMDDRGLESVPQLKILPQSDELSASLIYWVSTRGTGFDAARDILIDAHSGDVIADLSRNLEIAPINVYTTNKNGVDLVGCQDLDSDGRPNDLNLAKCAKVVSNGRALTSADATARLAASNSKTVLNYYQKTHARDSYDAKGSQVNSVVHIGKKFGNAFWSSDLKLMAYGDGDGVETGSFARALDVAGHEMTHGVVSSTANLIYMDESGALNEAFADFFGKMIANDGDWIIGKKIFLDPNSKGIRDLQNPGNLKVCAKRNFMGSCSLYKPYPASVKERFPGSATCNSSNDNCWVHVNSTIIGHAGYEMIQLVGKPKTEKLMYTVLTHYLTENSKFKDFASATNKACPQVLDMGSCISVRKALASVGL